MLPIQRYLDAAILKPEFTELEVIEALQTCIALEAYSVCVRPCDIKLAQRHCAGSTTAVCVVLGFPHGCQLPASKADEARRYLDLGVDEIDMVANYGWVRSGRWESVAADLHGVASLTRPAGVPLKVIFETAHLDSAAIIRMTELCIETGADFVKTSTGFNGPGARIEDVARMIEVAAGRIRVKPSGGIRTRAEAEAFIQMGADRLGVGWTACPAICGGTTDSSTQEAY